MERPVYICKFKTIGTYCGFYLTFCCPGWDGNKLRINGA